MHSRPHSQSGLLAILRDHQSEFSAAGIEAMTLFGSFARAEATATSDVDLAIRVGIGFSSGGFDHFGRLEALRQRLRALLSCEVDLVEEAAARPRLQDLIRREGVRAF